MATVRSPATIEANFPDNTTQSITPERLRDFVVTSLGVYGGVYATGQTSIDILMVSSTERDMPVFDTAMPVKGGVVADTTDGDLTVPVAGTYEVHMHLSAKFANAATSGYFRLANNGTAIDLDVFANFALNSDYYHVTIGGYVTLSANDVISLRLDANKSGFVSILSSRLYCRLVG